MNYYTECYVKGVGCKKKSAYITVEPTAPFRVDVCEPPKIVVCECPDAQQHMDAAKTAMKVNIVDSNKFPILTEEIPFFLTAKMTRAKLRLIFQKPPDSTTSVFEWRTID